MNAPGGKYGVKWSRDSVCMTVPRYLKLNSVNKMVTSGWGSVTWAVIGLRLSQNLGRYYVGPINIAVVRTIGSIFIKYDEVRT